jgi:hypothetical protein
MIEGLTSQLIGHLKWDEMFESEQDLINALMVIDIKRYKDEGYVGITYIEGFQKFYRKHHFLTDRQMTQLKRLAKEIYKYHNWD